MINIIMLVTVIALLVGGIFLQVFLSKRKSKWLGLILPIITFLYSIIMVLGIAFFDTMSGEAFVLVASVFLLSNIPTAVLLCIYFACREKINARSQIDKMNIHDL